MRGFRSVTLDIETEAYHRNGISGMGFKVFIAKAKDGEDPAKRMLIVQFPPSASKEVGNVLTAAFDLDKLAAGDIAFGSNSWRGDVYDAALPAWEE